MGGHNNAKSILVIEDERPLMDVIVDKLTREGFSVVSAKNGSQALDYMRNNIDVDAVWLDHYLFAHERGINFVIELKANPAWRHIPVFVVSNSGNRRSKGEYLAHGATKYFVKVEKKLDEIVREIILSLMEQPETVPDAAR